MIQNYELNDYLRALVENMAVNVGMDFRTVYSGRGMYGKSCVGITGTETDFQEFLQYMIIEFHNSDGEFDFEECLSILLNYQTDSMGLDTIWYWKSIRPTVE